MKKKLILLLLTLTLCSFNLTKVKAETINWKAMKLYSSEKEVFRRYTTKDGETKRSDNNIAYIYMGDNTIYCIEMGKDIYSDLGAGKATFTNKGELGKYFTKNLDKKVKIGKQEINIVDAVGLISKYGTEYYNLRKSQNKITRMNTYYLTTQAMIWQYLSEAGVYGDSIKGDIEIIYYKDGKEQVVDLSLYKSRIIEKIDAFYNEKPNIQGSVIAQPTEDGLNYQFTLTDSKKVLEKFKIQMPEDNEIKCTQEKNTITCTYPKDKTVSNLKFTFIREATQKNNKVFKAGDKYQATLLMDATPEIVVNKTVIVGEEKYRLAVKKVDADDNKTPIEGVTYQLCGDENCTEEKIIDTQITNDEGFVVFNDLDLGKYYVKEIETKEGYVLDSIPKLIEISKTDEKYDEKTFTYTTQYTNKKEVKEEIKGYIQINKTDKENNKPLEGITFDIYNEDDEIVETIKTDKDGKAKTNLLPKGLYYAKEKETLKEYILVEEEQVVKIEENNKTYELSFVNEKSPKTGETNILLLITIAGCTLICAIIIYIKKINLVKNNTN